MKRGVGKVYSEGGFKRAEMLISGARGDADLTELDHRAHDRLRDHCDGLLNARRL